MFILPDLKFIIFILFSFIICGLMLLGGYLLGGRSVSNNKNIPFESGIVAYGTTSLRFSIQFYLLAVCFVIFDIESLYLYAWVVNIKTIGWMGFLEIVLFILVILLSILYLVNNKVFNWGYKKILFEKNI